MIQSGTGQFKNIKFKLDGKPVTLTKTITFPKAFANPPVIVLNIIGAGVDFTTYGFSTSQGSAVTHVLKSYKLGTSKVSVAEFVVSLVANPISFIVPADISLDDLLLEFSWMAYDEVTIGA